MEGNAIKEKWDKINDVMSAMNVNDKELSAHMTGVQLLRQKVVPVCYVVADTLMDNTAAQMS